MALAFIANSITLSACGSSGAKTDNTENNSDVAQTSNYMAADTVAVPMATFDSIRGKVKKVVESYCYVKDTEAVEFEQGEYIDFYPSFAYYYNELGQLANYTGAGYIKFANIYDKQGRLIIKLQANEFDGMEFGYKTEYTYNDDGKLKETTLYRCLNTFNDKTKWEKSVLSNSIKNWNYYSAIDYVYDEAGKLKENIHYSYNEKTNEFEGEYTEEVTINPNTPHYNAKGEMLLNGHKFQCTFDKYGNWTTKIDYQSIDFDYVYVFIKRKIEYYE